MAKRANGEGTVARSANGTWEAKLTYADPATGQRRRVSFYGPTARAVRAKMKAARDRLEAGAPVRDATCGMKPDGTPKSCPRSNGGNGGGNGGNEANSTVVCERGFELMTIDAMLRSVAAPGTARDLKAADVNRNDHLCVQLAADGRSMTRFVDNSWAV